jgi:dienelactone hydrolase
LQPSPEALLSFYDYATPTTFSVRLLETRQQHLVYSVTWQSAVRSEYPADNQVPAFYYQPRRSGKLPAIVMLHGYRTRRAGNERRLCARLADQGVACLLPFLPYHYTRTPPGHMSGELMISGDVERTIQAVRQAMIDVRSAVDWLQERPEVDPDRIGIVGISLGGILVHLAMGVERRFSVGVSVLGGGEVAELMWSSPIVARVRRALDSEGIGLPELTRRLRVIEPLTYADVNRPRRVLMIGGRYDLVVPPQAVMATWHALREPEMIWLNTGHYGGALVSSQLSQVVSAYLLNQFGERRGPLPPLHDYTLKVGLLADERFGLQATLNLVLAHLGQRGFVDFALTTDGPLIGVSHQVGQLTELGIGVRLGKGHAEARPYLALVLVL